MKFETEVCVICGETIVSILDSHNPFPVREKGRCCTLCNDVHVIPARLEVLLKQQEKKNAEQTDGSKP